MGQPESPYDREWIHNGRSLRFRFRETSKMTADAWYRDMDKTFRSWDSDQLLLVLLDVRLQG